jgi:hypothetical protein
MIKKHMLWMILSMSVVVEAMDNELPDFPEQARCDALEKLAMKHAYQQASPMMKMIVANGDEQARDIKSTVVKGIGAVIDGQQETTRVMAVSFQNYQQGQEDIVRELQKQNRLFEQLVDQRNKSITLQSSDQAGATSQNQSAKKIKLKHFIRRAKTYDKQHTSATFAPLPSVVDILDEAENFVETRTINLHDGADRLARETAQLYALYKSSERVTPFPFEFHRDEKILLERIVRGEFADTPEMRVLQMDCVRLCEAVKSYYNGFQTNERGELWNTLQDALNSSSFQQWIRPYQQCMQEKGLISAEVSLLEQLKKLWVPGMQRLAQATQELYADKSGSFAFYQKEKELMTRIAAGEFADDSAEMKSLQGAVQDVGNALYLYHTYPPYKYRWNSPYDAINSVLKLVGCVEGSMYNEDSSTRLQNVTQNPAWIAWTRSANEEYDLVTEGNVVKLMPKRQPASNTVQEQISAMWKSASEFSYASVRKYTIEQLQQELAELHSFYQDPAQDRDYSNTFYEQRKALLYKIASAAFCDGSREMYDLSNCASQICNLAVRSTEASSPTEAQDIERSIQALHASPVYVQWFEPYERAMHARGRNIFYDKDLWKEQCAAHAHPHLDEECTPCGAINCVHDIVSKLGTTQCLWSSVVKPASAAVGCPCPI